MKNSKQASESLWRDRAFLLFWSGRAISLLGTAMTAVKPAASRCGFIPCG